MTDNGLINQQHYTMAQAARTALNQGDSVTALSLTRKVGIFLPDNLITIMSVFCTHPTQDMRYRALALFKHQLMQCTNTSGLLSLALWVRNSKREFFLPVELKQLIDERRLTLEPHWDGVWGNPGFESAQKTLNTFRGLHPTEVHDPETCLNAAAQRKDDEDLWLIRYLSLGGNPENPKYLKIKVAKVFASPSEKPTKASRQALRRYSEVAPSGEVRRFFRKLTPLKNSYKKSCNKHMGRYALFLYCNCERIILVPEDWVHIAYSALCLKEVVVQRIAQRTLASLNRTSKAQSIFEKLSAIHGPIQVTNSPLTDIGPGGNPIWQSVYNLLPIDANARRILFSYAEAELNES